MRTRRAAAIAIGVVLIAGCSSDGDTPEPGDTGAADETDATTGGATATTGDTSAPGTDATSTAVAEVADNPDHGVTADTISLGWMGDITGPTASAQSFNLHGSQAAVEWFNEQGGVLGRELVLVEKDDQFAAETAATNYSGLVNDDRVLALVGMGGAHITTALSPNVEADHLPVIGPQNTIDAQLDNPWFFNNLAHYGDEADVALEYISHELGGLDNANIAVIQLEIPSGDEWGLYIQGGLEELGGTYVDRITINSASPDFAGTVTRLRQMVDNDGVNFIAFHGAPNHALGMVTEMVTQGVSVPMVGIHGVAGSTIYQEGPPEAADLLHGVQSFLAPTSDCEMCSEIRDFVAGTEWEQDLHEINFGHGWLNVMLAVQAIERAAATGELSRDSLHEGLQGEFETGGLSCPIDWSSSNHSPCAAPFQWLTDQDRIEPIDGLESWTDVLDGEYHLFEG